MYYDRFTLATQNILGHEEFLVTDAFVQCLLHGSLSKKMQGMVPQSRDELKYRVKKYLREVEGEEREEANIKDLANAYIKQEEAVSRPNAGHRERQDGGHEKHSQYLEHPFWRYRPFGKDEHKSH